MARSRPSWLKALAFDIWGPPLIVFAIVIVIWQVVAAHQQYVLPSLSLVVRQYTNDPGTYFSNAVTTLQEAMVGTVASFVIAMALAIAMRRLVILERALMPLAVVINVTPVMAIAPGLIIAFGFGDFPKYIVTALVTFFPFLVNALVGLRSVDPGTREVFETLHASRRETLWRLELPSSLPFLFAAARVCLPLSLVGAVVAEFVVGGNELGLGSLIATSYTTTNLPPIYAAVIALAVIGVLMTVVVSLLERRLLSWHASTRWRARPPR